MAKIVRYGGNLKAFASEQQTNERTLFGQITVANDLTSQITPQFLRGWGIVGPSDQPSLQDFNAAMYTNSQILAYLHQMGVAEYNAEQEYFIGSLTTAAAVLYMSTANANIGNAPATSPASWKTFTTDQATELLLGLVKIATQALTNAGTDDNTAVTPKKLATSTQGQKHTAFITTGTATAQILTPTPAISAYEAGQRFNATFNVASGLNPTINVSGQGAKSLKQYDATGAKVAAVFAANQNSDIFYDGTDWVLLDQLPSTTQRRQSLRGQAVNWKSSADGLSSSYICSADSVILANTAGDTTVVDNIALTLNTAATASATVDGMATGAVAASTWYNVYVWQNSATGVKRVTADNNYTTGLAPTPPAAGFDLWARRGCLRTDSTANKYPLRVIQTGDRAQWGVAAGSNGASIRMMASGAATNTAVPLATFVPNSARTIQVLLVQVTASAACVAPSSSYGASNDNVNPPPVSTYFIGGSGGATSKMPGDFVIEGPNIYWTAVNEKLFCVGYEDSL